MPIKQTFYRAGQIALLVATGYSSNAVAATSAANTCSSDLDDIAAFLPINDAGAETALQHHGAAIDTALASARNKTLEVSDNAACDAILRSYLKAWRRGHLSLGPWPWTMATSLSVQGKPESGVDPFLSTLKVLSKKTVLLVFPTFYDAYKGDIAALLKKNRLILESHPNWIVDVRKNNGGSDATYAPLLPWIMSGSYASYNTAWLATPANLHAQETVCSLASDQAECKRFVKPVVAALRNTAPGHYTLADGEEALSYGIWANLEKRRPRHVAVLIDHACGSSCEQFLLTVRESQSVKLLGRPTSGELDVSNLRPHPLPSGIRAVFYATSRSLRLPSMAIDDVGIQPDILLPKPVDTDSEIIHAQRWLEGGSLQ